MTLAPYANEDYLDEEEPRQEAPTEKSAVGVLVLILVLLLCSTTLATFVSLLQGGRVSSILNSTGSVAMTATGETVAEITRYVVPAGLLLIVMRYIRGTHRRAGSLLIVYAALAALQLSTWEHTGGFTAQGLGPVITIALAATAVWAVSPTWRDARAVGWVGAGVAAFSLGFAMVSAKGWWVAPNDESKAFVGDRVLAGPFSQMNPLGMGLAICLPFTLLIENKVLRVLAFSITAFALFLTASRTAVIAAAAAMVLGLIFALVQRSVKSRRLVFLGAGVLGIGITALLPYLTTDPTAFTNRGRIWLASSPFWRDNIWLGLGEYSVQGDISRVLKYFVPHAHNLFIQTMTTGGLLLLGLLTLMFIIMFRSSYKILHKNSALALGFVTMLVLGIAEVPFRFEVFDSAAWATWSVVIICLIARVPEQDTYKSPTSEDEVGSLEVPDESRDSDSSSPSSTTPVN